MYGKLTKSNFEISGLKAESDKLDPLELFSGVNTAAPVIVAVSGGGDSMALLLLAAAWASAKNAMLQVVTVDHGLRPEAAAEAAFVASICERMGVSHVTLAWDGTTPKPMSGISEAARYARYCLIEEFAEDIGASTILTGHTGDDQAETIYMRLQREHGQAGSANGGRGLAGMARTTLLPGGTKLVRPLLNVRRRALRNYLAECSQSWLEDPSNQDESYERVRARNQLSRNEALSRRLLAFGSVMARLRQVNARRAAEVLYTNVKIKAGPIYEFSPKGLGAVPEVAISHALQVVVALAGGQEHLVSASKLATLVDLLQGKVESTKKFRMTLGRAVIEGTSKGLVIYREVRNLPAILIGPGDEAWWDGRFKITNHSTSGIFIGTSDMRNLLAEEERRGTKILVKPRVVLSSTPVLKFDSDELYYPMAEKRSLPPRVYVKLVSVALEHFCPEWDLPLVEWIRDLELEGKDEFMGRSSN